MYIVLGGTGRVGSALVETLLSRGEQVTLVARDRTKARRLEARGARVVIADIRDVDALRRAYQEGERLYMLNPSADTSTDTQARERETVANMVRALGGSRIKKVIAHSTFGARPGDLVGDLNVLYEMEEAIKRTGIPNSVLRAAYYMSNWGSALATAKEGVVKTFFPVDLKFAMVAPRDLGVAAADLMMAPIEQCECVLVEGPARYSSADVAAAFAAALGREVRAETIPERDWIDTYRKLGFSERAAISYANMTRTLYEKNFPPESSTVHGKTSLREFIRQMALSPSGERAAT
jgi:uncharacterized protein YbjT (DUF2867 family)